MSETRSVRVVGVSTVKTRQVKLVASPDTLRKRLKKQEMKKLADAYKFHDPCAHIRSVGNGL